MRIYVPPLPLFWPLRRHLSVCLSVCCIELGKACRQPRERLLTYSRERESQKGRAGDGQDGRRLTHFCIHHQFLPACLPVCLSVCEAMGRRIATVSASPPASLPPSHPPSIPLSLPPSLPPSPVSFCLPVWWVACPMVKCRHVTPTDGPVIHQARPPDITRFTWGWAARWIR